MPRLPSPAEAVNWQILQQVGIAFYFFMTPRPVAGCRPNLWYVSRPIGVAAVASILRISCHCRRDLWCAPCRCRLGRLDMSRVGPRTCPADSLRHPFHTLSFIKNCLPSPNLLYRVPLYKTLRHSRFVFFRLRGCLS